MEKTTIIKKLEKIYENKKYDNLKELIEELKIDAISTYSSGKINAKAYFKSFQKNNHYEQFRSSFMQSNGKYAICDGYKMIQFEDENDEIAKALYTKSDIKLNYEDIRGEMKKNLHIDTLYLEKLVEYNRVNKTNAGYVDEINENTYIELDAKWLLDLLKLNNTDVINLGSNVYAPVEIKSEKYSCILLPRKMGESDNSLDVKNEILKLIKEAEINE